MYKSFVSTIRQSISSDNGISPQEILFLASHTIPKTTSGKISRSRVKEEYSKNQLQVCYRGVMADCDMKDDSIQVTSSTTSVTSSSSGSFSNGKVSQTTVSMLQGIQPVSRDGSSSNGSSREIEMMPLSPIEEQSAEETPNTEIEIVLPSQLDGVNTVGIMISLMMMMMMMMMMMIIIYSCNV